MPILFLLVAMMPSDDAVMTAYRDRTRAEPACAAPADDREILVCGRRQADRYRVPFVGIAPRDDVPAERAELLAPRISGCGRIGAFFADCGFVGVTATTGAGGTKLRPRALAP